MKANWIGQNLYRNCLIKHVIKGKNSGYKWEEDAEEHVGSYWLTLMKWEDAGNWRKKP